MPPFSFYFLIIVMIIAIDFDGTVVTHEYPRIGMDIGAIPVLKELQDSGHKLILLTMRSGKTLGEAIDWLKERGINLYAANINPNQYQWTTSRKVYANYYIDDQALGCPLIYNSDISDRGFVDWVRMREILAENGLII